VAILPFKKFEQLDPAARFYEFSLADASGQLAQLRSLIVPVVIAKYQGKTPGARSRAPARRRGFVGVVFLRAGDKYA